MLAPSELLASMRDHFIINDESNLDPENYYDATPAHAADYAAKTVRAMIRAKCKMLQGAKTDGKNTEDKNAVKQDVSSPKKMSSGSSSAGKAY